VVLSADLFSIPADQIKNQKVILTMVGGKVVYQQSE
jgi:predicted amidohydrolase YtcJ